MRRFTLTSDKITGEIELWYNFEGMLCRVDLVNTSMSYLQIQYLLQNLSPDVEQFKGMLSGANLAIKEVQFDLSLDDFKREYPYSRNYHLLDARWAKMAKREQVKAFFAAIDYRKYCERNSKWYKQPKIADSWLANKEYLNDWKKM
jgi:adenine-specific DNA methylase